MIRVADYILKRIAEEGVTHAFYVSGGQCVYFMDALRRTGEAGVLKGIATHHEQAAAFASIAYSQHTKNMGACIVTTGCAGTNTMTGLLHAWQDSIPCIFVSGQQAVEQTTHGYYKKTGVRLRQIGVQEADIVHIVEPVTKYAVMIDDLSKVAYEVDKAIYYSREGRPGPVWIDVPLPIQNSMIDEENVERYDKYIDAVNALGKDSLSDLSTENLDFAPEVMGRPSASEEDVEYITEALKKADRPVIFAGHGVQSAHAEKQLKKFAEKNHIPVVFTRFSVDMMEYDNPYNFGVVCSFSANRHANFIIQNSDFVLAIGNRLSIDTTGPNQKQLAREAEIVVIDVDENEHKKDGVKIDRFVKADAKDILEKLIDSCDPVDRSDWMEKCQHWKDVLSKFEYKVQDPSLIDFKEFLWKLTKHLPDKTTVLADAGMTGAIISANVHMKKNDRLIHAYAQGEMGFVMPGACGAACASEDGTIVSITGDGSVMMNLQELQTFVRNGFNIKLIINNNNGYSGVRHGQRSHFRGKTQGTDSSNGLDFPDFGKVSEAFGIRYVKIDHPEDIDTKLDDVFSGVGPCVCEVVTDPDQYDLHNAFVMYGKRKIGMRPIEDQAPYIDREVFFEEMIVEPLEESSGRPL